MASKRKPRELFVRDYGDSVIGLSSTHHASEDACYGGREGSDRKTATFKVAKFVEVIEEYDWEGGE